MPVPWPVPYPGMQRHLVTPDRHLSASLSPDTATEGVRRLGWLALVYAIGNITAPYARLVLPAVAGRVDSSDFGIPDVFGLAAVIMAFGVFAEVRRGALSSRRLLDLGLVFQVVGALGIAFREFWQGLPPTAGSWFLVPGECVWLVAYPLLVPNTPRKILVASLLAASMVRRHSPYPQSQLARLSFGRSTQPRTSSRRATCARSYRPRPACFGARPGLDVGTTAPPHPVARGRLYCQKLGKSCDD